MKLVIRDNTVFPCSVWKHSDHSPIFHIGNCKQCIYSFSAIGGGYGCRLNDNTTTWIRLKPILIFDEKSEYWACANWRLNRRSYI